MPLKIGAIPDARLKIGESQHWNVESKALYYPDVHGNALHRYVPSTNEHTTDMERSGNSILLTALKGLLISTTLT